MSKPSLLLLFVITGLSIGIVAGVISDEYAASNGRLIAPILGASVALIIAFGAYPWQKQKDRELRLDEERRDAYRDFFRTSTELRAALGRQPDDVVHRLVVEIGAKYQSLCFYAPNDVIQACGDLIVSLRKVDGIADRMEANLEDPTALVTEGYLADLENHRLAKEAFVLARMSLLRASREQSEDAYDVMYQFDGREE